MIWGLDTVELIMLIEKKLEIDFVDSKLEKISLVGDIAEYAYQLQKKNKSLNEVQGIIIDILVEDFSVPRTEITLGSCIVKDLRMD